MRNRDRDNNRNEGGVSVVGMCGCNPTQQATTQFKSVPIKTNCVHHTRESAAPRGRRINIEQRRGEKAIDSGWGVGGRLHADAKVLITSKGSGV